MSSQRHGLKSRKLGFYDLLQTLAFKHCDGVVDIQRPPDVNGTDAVSITYYSIHLFPLNVWNVASYLITGPVHLFCLFLIFL